MNVIEDTKKHIELVRSKLLWCASECEVRSDLHDASKLYPPESEMFEKWRPKLDAMDIQSQEYKDALAQMMKEALPHHYLANAHHPEHHLQGIRGMNLIDVIEMVCDWKAAAERKGQTVNLDWAKERFGIDDQLLSIIKNTLDMLPS